MPDFMIRKETYPIEKVLDLIAANTTKKDVVEFDGDKVRLGSERYKVFKFKGICCVGCGLEAQYFRKERFKAHETDSWHFNLYAVRDGVEILFTKDHIVPKSKGGKDKLSNYQTMCQPCNWEKRDKLL